MLSYLLYWDQVCIINIVYHVLHVLSMALENEIIEN
jgi:hypothetical protein